MLAKPTAHAHRRIDDERPTSPAATYNAHISSALHATSTEDSEPTTPATSANESVQGCENIDESSLRPTKHSAPKHAAAAYVTNSGDTSSPAQNGTIDSNARMCQASMRANPHISILRTAFPSSLAKPKRIGTCGFTLPIQAPLELSSSRVLFKTLSSHYNTVSTIVMVSSRVKKVTPPLARMDGCSEEKTSDRERQGSAQRDPSPQTQTRSTVAVADGDASLGAPLDTSSKDVAWARPQRPRCAPGTISPRLGPHPLVPPLVGRLATLLATHFREFLNFSLTGHRQTGIITSAVSTCAVTSAG